LLAIHLGRQRGALGEVPGGALLGALQEVPRRMRELLDDGDRVRALARRLVRARHVIFVGRGLALPVALEGALKLKEISYAHAEGCAGGEAAQSVLAIVDEGMPVVVVAPQGPQHEQALGDMREARARGGHVVALATEGDLAVTELAQHVIWLPRVDPRVTPLLAVIPLQLLAYYVASLAGNDVDQPRNLAKTVTVE
jgi:glucosamine--fructose-6-phosphate aminotransferase (isomerizing)